MYMRVKDIDFVFGVCNCSESVTFFLIFILLGQFLCIQLSVLHAISCVIIKFGH